MNEVPQTLAEAIRYFSNSDRCRAYLVKKRWPNGLRCPRCGSSQLYFTTPRQEWECKTRHPRRKFTLKTGTVFEDSPLGFDKWLPAVWMIANGERVTSRDIRDVVGVTQLTAWFMMQRIRFALDDAYRGKTGLEEG